MRKKVLGAMDDRQWQRDEMVKFQIDGRGITDKAVLAAMRTVPREHFVDPTLRGLAYEDRPLSIGAGQTISQPYVIALMIEALGLRDGDTVLEVGAGSGYAAALLAEIAGFVYAIERIERLAKQAVANLEVAGYDDVKIRLADGTAGWPGVGPFDAILVSAGAPGVPNVLKCQLAIGGRMVVPVGADQRDQVLVLVTRVGEDAYKQKELGDVRFVPLVGREGWQSNHGFELVFGCR